MRFSISLHQAARRVPRSVDHRTAIQNGFFQRVGIFRTFIGAWLHTSAPVSDGVELSRQLSVFAQLCSDITALQFSLRAGSWAHNMLSCQLYVLRNGLFSFTSG